MYAVVSSGGKQYRVEAGTTLTMERMDVEPGGSVTFDRVLLIGDGDDVTVGTPVVSGASVSATVLGEELGPKLVIFKFKQKVKYRRRTGHRQHLVRVRIDEISASGSKPKAAAKSDGTSAKESSVKESSAKQAPAGKPRASRAKPKAEAAAKGEPAKPKAPRTAKPKAAKPKAAKPKAEE